MHPAQRQRVPQPCGVGQELAHRGRASAPSVRSEVHGGDGGIEVDPPLLGQSQRGGGRDHLRHREPPKGGARRQRSPRGQVGVTVARGVELPVGVDHHQGQARDAGRPAKSLGTGREGVTLTSAIS